MMSRNRSLYGLLMLVGVLLAVSSIPAAAEYFSCNDRPGQVLYSYTGTPDQYIRRQRRYSAPRSYRRHYSRAARHSRRAYYGSTRYWNGR